MKIFNEKYFDWISGGEAWITGSEQNPILIVTNQSVVSCGNVQFYSDHIAIDGHNVFAEHYYAWNQGASQTDLGISPITSVPYYDRSGNRIGMIYQS